MANILDIVDKAREANFKVVPVRLRPEDVSRPMLQKILQDKEVTFNIRPLEYLENLKIMEPAIQRQKDAVAQADENKRQATNIRLCADAILEANVVTGWNNLDKGLFQTLAGKDMNIENEEQWNDPIVYGENQQELITEVVRMMTRDIEFAAFITKSVSNAPSEYYKTIQEQKKT